VALKTVPLQTRRMAVIGLEVPHAHVLHLIPLNEMDEMRFTNKVTLDKMSLRY
jgi:histidine triad (HIT) family protein